MGDQERKKRKQAKEWADKFFKIFDVAHNGDLDFNEFKKGCQIINIKWQTLFVEVQKKREEIKLEQEKIQKQIEEKIKKEKMQKFHDEIQAAKKKKDDDNKDKDKTKEEVKPDDDKGDDEDKDKESKDDKPNDDKPNDV